MIKSSAAPGKARLTTDGDKDARSRAEETRYQRNLFIVMALNMSWQMAIVVVVPIVGGFKLDQALNTTPALTIIGFLVAMAGMFVVMKRAVSLADRKVDERRSQQ